MKLFVYNVDIFCYHLSSKQSLKESNVFAFENRYPRVRFNEVLYSTDKKAAAFMRQKIDT